MSGRIARHAKCHQTKQPGLRCISPHLQHTFCSRCCRGFIRPPFSARPWYRFPHTRVAASRILCAGCVAAPVLGHCSYSRNSWATSVERFHGMLECARRGGAFGAVLRCEDCHGRWVIGPVTTGLPAVDFSCLESGRVQNTCIAARWEIAPYHECRINRDCGALLDAAQVGGYCAALRTRKFESARGLAHSKTLARLRGPCGARRVKS